VQERDLREAPRVPPPQPDQPPRVRPDLKESSPSAPHGNDGGPPAGRRR
jgi:hypothetical protein